MLKYLSYHDLNGTRSSLYTYPRPPFLPHCRVHLIGVVLTYSEQGMADLDIALVSWLYNCRLKLLLL